MHISRVSTTYVTLLYEFLAGRNLDAEALLGPLPDERETPHVTIPRWRQMLEVAEARVGGPAFGLQVARGITPRHFGIVGYLVLACGNLGEALARAERFASLVYDVNPLRLAVEPGRLVMRWGTEYGRPGQLVDETGLAALVHLGRDITGERWPLDRVAFVNEAPPDAAPYHEFFGGQVLFGEPCTELHFPLDYLQLPLRRPDPGLLSLLDRQAEAMLARAAPAPGGDPFRRALIRQLREGDASLQGLAAAMGMSPRTLQRRLAEEGLGFQALLDQTRRMQAEEYLQDPRLPLADVAVLLGYSEQSAFTRAFRNWTGKTPLRWRRSLLAQRSDHP